MRDNSAIWQPTPNFGFPYQGNSGRMGQKPQWIILHSTAGGGAVEWLTNPASGVSAHYVIKQDGSIYQLVDEGDASWANGVLEDGHDPWWSTSANPNLLTITIEHEKLDKTNQIPLRDAQAASSFQLISRICQRWNIPRGKADASGGITGHFSITPINRKDCPGPYPWDQLWTFLKGGATTKAIEQAAQDTWNSTAHLFGGTPLSYTTGIAKSWHDLYVNQQRTMPPPTTREFKSVDWSGNAVIVQFFGNMRCEWDTNGQAHWFKTGL